MMNDHLHVLTSYICIFCLQMSTPYSGTENLLKTYCPGGCKSEKDVIKGIDVIEKRDRNDYLTDTEMARITNDGVSKLAFLKRISIFQLILNFIEEAMLIIPPSAQIDKIRDNYAGMMKQSQKAYDVLSGVTRLHAGETSRLKRPKTPEIPKFDVHESGMQTFLNSMELLSHSYKFADDKELSQFYLNNLTENSKTTIFTMYPLSDTSFYMRKFERGHHLS